MPASRSMLTSPISIKRLLSPVVVGSYPVDAADPIEVEDTPDTDAETDVQTICDETNGDESTPTLLAPPVPFALTDFSNLLGLGMDAGGDQDSVTVVDPEAFCVAAVDADLYGWEAALEPKPKPGSPIPGSVNMYNAGYHYRRPSGIKRSLLHRVFSLGGGPRDMGSDMHRARAGS